MLPVTNLHTSGTSLLSSQTFHLVVASSVASTMVKLSQGRPPIFSVPAAVMQALAARRYILNHAKNREKADGITRLNEITRWV